MKMLSRSTVYGLRALIYLASRKEADSFTSIGEIADHLGVSFHFLTKTFQVLTREGMLQSYRGPNGGIMLAHPASEITLGEIVRLLEGADFFDKCLLGLPGCGTEAPCPVHDYWKVAKQDMKAKFDSTTLAELGKKVSRKRLRLQT